MIEREIAEFGRRMGMPAFSLSPAGLAALDVERLGRLHLELAENAGERELLVYLARAVPEHDVKAPRRVLERCHYRHADPMPLSGGLHKGHIILLTRFPERQATAAGIPVYGSEEEQVKNGCLASIGLDYVALGKVTGEMALEVLGGADASGMSVKTITDTTPFVNRTVMEQFHITLPAAYQNATFVEAE